MRMAVDLPAPFSPTMAWIVPGRTVILTRSLASVFPNRLLMFRSSSILLLLFHRVGYFDLSGNDFSLCVVQDLNHLGRQQVLVVFVERISDAIIVETVDVCSAHGAAFDAVAHNLINRIVD